MSYNPQQPNSGRPMPPNYGQQTGSQQPYSQQQYSQQPGARSYTYGPYGSQQAGYAQPGYGQAGYPQPGPGQPGYAQPGYAQPGVASAPPMVNPALLDSRNLPEAAYGPGSAQFWMPTESERTTAMWSHIGSLFFGYLPLIMFLVKKDESPFVREHTRQGLNAMITNTIFTVGAFFVFGLIGIALAFFTFGISMFLMYTAIIVPIVYMVLYIIAAVAANRGEGYKMPLVFQFVK
jgi:uncharacterized Tic20 family protein